MCVWVVDSFFYCSLVRLGARTLRAALVLVLVLVLMLTLMACFAHRSLSAAGRADPARYDVAVVGDDGCTGVGVGACAAGGLLAVWCL